MDSRRNSSRVSGRLKSTDDKLHSRPTQHASAIPTTQQSNAQSSTHLYPLPPPYGRTLSSSTSLASSLSSIRVADEEDDDVSELLNGTYLHPSAPATPQRPTSIARHLSSPLTLSHFDQSPIRHHTAQPAPPSPLPFPANFAASSASSSTQHTASLLLPALELWRLRLLRSAFHDWLHRIQRLCQLQSAFEQWRHNKSDAKQQRSTTLYALQHWSYTHQRNAFDHWHDITTRPQRATLFYYSRLTDRLFSAWAGWVRRRKWLYETAHAVVDRGEERVKREVLGEWLGQVRQRIVADGWRVQRAGTQAIDRWRGRVAAERRWKWQQEQGRQWRADREKARVREVVAQWQSVVSQQRQSRLKAAQAECHYQRRVMRVWRQQVPAADKQRATQKHQRAVQFHSLRLQQRALTAWHGHSQSVQRQGEWLTTHESNRRKSEAFHGWLSLRQHVEAYRAAQEQAAAEMQSKRAVLAFFTLFSHWLRLTRLLILDRQRLSFASDHQRSSSLSSSLSTWSWFTRRRRHIQTLSATACVHHSRRMLSTACSLWFTTYRRSHAIERVQAMLRGRLLGAAFGEWRDAVLHKRIAIAQRQRQQRTLHTALSWWQHITHRSGHLTAATAHFHTVDRQRYQRVAFTHWRTFYLIHHQRRLWQLRVTFCGWLQQVEETREQRALLQHVVVQWRAEAVRFRQQRLLSLRLYRQRLLLPAIAALQQHARWKRSQQQKTQLASSHYHRTIASHSHHSRYMRTAYLAWYYYTRHRRQLMHLSDILQQRQARVMLSSALSVWHQQTEQLTLADEWRRRYAQTQAIGEWRNWTA